MDMANQHKLGIAETLAGIRAIELTKLNLPAGDRKAQASAE